MCNRKLLVICSILFFASLSLIPQISDANPLENWHLRSHFPVGTVLYRAIYANDFFVGVGWDAMGYGVIYTSSDGITWTKRDIGGTNPLGCIAYGNNILVVVGAYGTILTSLDGITWTERESGTAKTFYAITYANNTFMVVGESGGIFTSPDGTTWTERDSGMTNPLYAVAYGNNRFVAGGGTSDKEEGGGGSASQKWGFGIIDSILSLFWSKTLNLTMPKYHEAPGLTRGKVGCRCETTNLA